MGSKLKLLNFYVDTLIKNFKIIFQIDLNYQKSHYIPKRYFKIEKSNDFFCMHQTIHNIFKSEFNNNNSNPPDIF